MSIAESAVQRRELRFESIQQVMEDVRHLADADRAGRLQRIGNWTLGQTLGHLAYWANAAYEPIPLKTPWFIRMFLKLRKKSALYGKMPQGIRIPRVEGGTLGTEPLPLDEGLRRCEAALGRLQHESPTQPSAAFGPLTHEEWIALTCRHAELHLSFFRAG